MRLLLSQLLGARTDRDFVAYLEQASSRDILDLAEGNTWTVLSCKQKKILKDYSDTNQWPHYYFSTAVDQIDNSYEMLYTSNDHYYMRTSTDRSNIDYEKGVTSNSSSIPVTEPVQIIPLCQTTSNKMPYTGMEAAMGSRELFNRANEKIFNNVLRMMRLS